MNALSLALRALAARPLPAMLCFLTTACSVALLCAVFLLSGVLADSVTRNARGVDIVVGAKGSPLQLILSTLYHADIPTGNISGGSARMIAGNSQIRTAIPLALGDNVNGYRIVGTTPDYLSIYDATLADGRLWQAPLEAVAGAGTGIKTGDKFIGSHGLEPGGEGHGHRPYTVTGVLAPTGTVIDRLVLTSVQSVYEIHNVIADDHGEDEGHDHGHEHDHGHSHDHHDETPHEHGADVINFPVTALLLYTKSPIARMNLPRHINMTENIMAVSPSFEIARAMQRIGLGRDATIILAAGLGVLAALMILGALATGMAARGYDLAVLRVMGASPSTILTTVMAEGILIAVTGAALGVLAGHGLAAYAAQAIDHLGGLIDPRILWRFSALDAALIVAAAGVGMVAALVPAIMAARTDIAGILSRGK